MQRLFDYFLRIFTFPRHFTLAGVIHALLVVCGILILYLLTLREDEEGKLEDYLLRLRKRIHHLREKALSYHLAFINVTAAVLSSILDRVFGHKLVSLQSLGVMLALSLFSTNGYFVVAGVQTSDFVPEHIIGCITALTFAAVPFAMNKVFGPSCSEGGINVHFRPLKCRYLTDPPLPHSSIVQSGLSNWAQQYNFACFCSETWISLWFFALSFYIYREYLQPFFCVYCFPVEIRPFLAVVYGVLFVIFVTATTLFILFSVTTRLSLKKLSAVTSTPKALAYLLLGCLPIAVFIILLKFVLVMLNRWLSGGHVLKEWIAVGLLVVFAMAFLINAFFLIAPAFFFVMAILLLFHRLIWPILERPIEKLNSIGITKHPKVIATIGTVLILIGLGKLSWIETVLKYLPIK